MVHGLMFTNEDLKKDAIAYDKIENLNKRDLSEEVALVAEYIRLQKVIRAMSYNCEQISYLVTASYGSMYSGIDQLESILKKETT